MRLFTDRPQKILKRGHNISDTLAYDLMDHCFALNTFWLHLWSITEQTQGNMDSIFLTGPLVI